MVLSIVSPQNRQVFLADLSYLGPIIFALGGDEAAMEVCYSILEVGMVAMIVVC